MRIAAFLSLWVACGTVVILSPSLWLRTPAWILIGFVLHGITALVHEAGHGMLFPTRRMNQWVGFVLGILVIIPPTTFRVAHLYHHAHPREDSDPDEYLARLPNWLVPIAGRVVMPAAGTLFVFIHQPLISWKLANHHSRKRILKEYVGVALCWTALVVTLAEFGQLEWLIWLWMIPLVFGSLLGGARGHLEHFRTTNEDEWTQTRTTITNPLVSFFLCNQNFHLEHHLMPQIPWHNLRRAHEILCPVYETRPVYMQRSYASGVLRFLWHGPTTIDEPKPFRRSR